MTKVRLLRCIGLLFVLAVVGAVGLVIVQLAAINLGGYHSTLDDELDALSRISQLIQLVVIAPLVEETVYRLALMRRMRHFLVILSALALGLFWWPLVFAAVAMIAVWAIPAWREGSSLWWEANPRWPIWIYISGFGLVHLVNFDIDWSVATVVVAPLVVGPQLWVGLLFTIGRVRFGWWVGVAQHAMYNLFIWLVLV